MNSRSHHECAHERLNIWQNVGKSKLFQPQDPANLSVLTYLANVVTPTGSSVLVGYHQLVYENDEDGTHERWMSQQEK